MKKLTIIILLIILTPTSSFSQGSLGGFRTNDSFLNHEVAFFAGVYSLQTDYGERFDINSEIANNSLSLSLVHYLTFYNIDNRWNSRSSSWDNFALKTELNYLSNGKLKHYGKWADGTSKGAEKLRAMTGEVSMFTTSISGELYWHEIESFVSGWEQGRIFNPFINFGVGYSWFSNKLKSTLGNWEEDPSILPTKYRPKNHRAVGSNQAFSINFGGGTRARLTEKLDLAFNLKFQYFFSDEIDGLNANVPENKNNDWLLSGQLGLIWHLNFDAPLFY